MLPSPTLGPLAPSQLAASMDLELMGLDNAVAIWGMEDVLVGVVVLVAVSLLFMAWKNRSRATNVFARGWYLFLATLGLLLSVIFGTALAGGWRAGGASGKSMLPTMAPHNLIVVDSHAYGVRRPFGGWFTGPRLPQRGQVVSFHFRVEGADRLLSKRVVGVPGDEVVYEDGQLLVNGIPVAAQANSPTHMAGVLRASRQSATLAGALFEVWAPQPGQDSLHANQVVPAGHVFVVGDNWAESFDSRQFGVVPVSGLRGQVRWAWSGEHGWQVH